MMRIEGKKKRKGGGGQKKKRYCVSISFITFIKLIFATIKKKSKTGFHVERQINGKDGQQGNEYKNIFEKKNRIKKRPGEPGEGVGNGKGKPLETPHAGHDLHRLE